MLAHGSLERQDQLETLFGKARQTRNAKFLYRTTAGKTWKEVVGG